MTPNIELATELAKELWNHSNNCITLDDFLETSPAIITRHLTTHTQSLEEENKALKEALVKASNNPWPGLNIESLKEANAKLEEENKRLQEQVKDLAFDLAHAELDRQGNMDENKRLREALDVLEQSLQTAGSFKAWDSEAQEDYYFSQSLAFQNGKEAYQNARAKALTKPT